MILIWFCVHTSISPSKYDTVFELQRKYVDFPSIKGLKVGFSHFLRSALNTIPVFYLSLYLIFEMSINV